MHGWKGRGRHRCGARGKSPYFALFTEIERSGVDWRIRFLSSLFQDGGRTPLATSKSNSIPFSREREDHFRGRRGASLPLSTDCPQDLLSGDSEGGASVLIFRVVAQATCSKLKSTISPSRSMQHQRSISARYLSLIPPSLQARDSGLSPSSWFG